MLEVQVTLSANAGISIKTDRHCLWVDALHKDQQPGFSALSQELFQKVMNSDAFKAPDYICVTHDHPDHYSEEMVQSALAMWPHARLCLPQREGLQVQDEDLKLQFVRLPHEGAQYADVLHCGILISIGEKHILIAGDCETASPALAQAVGDREIDLAILNFPWVTLSKGRAFLTQHLKPRHILLCHLPFAQDDVNGFLRSAQRSAQLLPQMDVRLLCDALQTETVNI